MPRSSTKRKAPPVKKRAVRMPPGEIGSGPLWQKPVVQNLIVLLLGILVYSNTFAIPFAFDDIPNITDNFVVKDISRIIGPQILRENRPVTQLTFALNYRVHGFAVAGYHAVNLAIHLLNAVLVYWLTLLTFRTSRAATHPAPEDGRPPFPAGWVPLFTALLFVSHPIQTQAVSYIVQRSASLATFFCLLSLIAYIRARGDDTPPRARYAFFAAAVVSAALAMKSKETAFPLPVVVLLYEFLFFAGDVRKRVFSVLALLLTMLIVPLSYSVLRGVSVLDSVRGIAEAAGISPGDYLTTQFRVVMTYLRLLLFPVNQNLDYDYPLFRTFWDPQVVLSSLCLGGILSGAIYLLYRSSRTAGSDRWGYRVIAFGVFWFFVTLSVESSVIPIADVINEHRLYLPSIGFFLAAGAGAALIRTRLADRSTVVAGAFIPLLVIAVTGLSLAAYARNGVWRDAQTLWEDVVKKSPAKVRPRYNLGEVYLNQGRFADAIREFQTALRLAPDQAQSHYNLGMAYQKQGRLEDAVGQYQRALALDPKLVKAHHNLGAIYQQRGYLDDAIREYKTAIGLNPALPASHYSLAVVYLTQGRLAEAIEEYRTVIRLKPDHADAHNDLGVAYEDQGRLAEAIEQFRTAIGIQPDHQNANANLTRATKNRVPR